jgi:Mg-chelatase subunit ChlD
MKYKTLSLTLGIAITLVIIPITATWAHPPCKVEVKCVRIVPREVDIAICLDTSGSMNGLIESAKQKLWAIVNELALARPRPKLRVALYHYGNDGLNSETGWVKQLCPLTDDLDKIYEELFKLRTNGGTELVSRVVRAATNNLNWSSQKNALKMIVVAGNEPATQDQKYDLHDICKTSINKGIIINTIFCGNPEQGRRTGWADAATWAEGQYSAIDQDRGTVIVKPLACPR